MHPRHATRAAAIALALAIGGAASCSSDDDSADAFCRDIAAVQDDLLNADSADPAAIADGLAQADPPSEIADAYHSVLELYQSLRDDPASLTESRQRHPLRQPQQRHHRHRQLHQRTLPTRRVARHHSQHTLRLRSRHRQGRETIARWARHQRAHPVIVREKFGECLGVERCR
jgi:hypothetical protein